MKYSRNIVVALLGECFDADEVGGMRKSYEIEVDGELDVLAVLLFFFLYQPGFRPNRFLQYFTGIRKITDLKGRKERFRDLLETAFGQLARVRVRNVPFLRYERVGNNWRYTLSEPAAALREHFVCELEEGAFWIRRRRGVSVSYLGAYIYLLGVCGKCEIDLKYLAGQRILDDFFQGYQVWKARKLLRCLMAAFSERGIFRYGKRLEKLNDFVLHVRPNRSEAGFRCEKAVEDYTVRKCAKTVWKGGKPAGRASVIVDNVTPAKLLASQIGRLNSMNMDIRCGGRMLPGQTLLEYEDGALKKLRRFRCPVSGIRRSEWKNITFGTEGSSIIEIEYLRTLYILSSLKGRKAAPAAGPNRFLEKIPERFQPLICEVALEALFTAAGNRKQARQIFRRKCYRYTGKGATRHEINSFFHYLTDRYFQLGKRLKSCISESRFMRSCLKAFLGTAGDGNVPFIAAENAVIVPRGTENDFLQALSDSCREVFGDKRLATFKVTCGDSVKRYRFTALTRKREVA